MVSVPDCFFSRNMVPEKLDRPLTTVPKVESIADMSTSAVSGSNPDRPSGNHRRHEGPRVQLRDSRGVDVGDRRAPTKLGCGHRKDCRPCLLGPFGGGEAGQPGLVLSERSPLLVAVPILGNPASSISW